MNAELKAFKFYKKNIDRYLKEIESFWGDDEKLIEMYCGIASKFGASGEKLMAINQISYQRSVERAFR